jgi:hypothetical protein
MEMFNINVHTHHQRQPNAIYIFAVVIFETISNIKVIESNAVFSADGLIYPPATVISPIDAKLDQV